MYFDTSILRSRRAILFQRLLPKLESQVHFNTMCFSFAAKMAADTNNQMKNDPRSCDRNFFNCVKKPEKNSGLQRGLNPWPREYRCDALPTELWSHWRWERVNCGFICSRERYVNEWCIWNKSYVNCGYEMKWRMILAVVIAIFTIT